MPVRLGVLGAAALPAVLAASTLLMLPAAAIAQSPSPAPAIALPQPKPVTGFVPTFEIMRTVRAAGFDPLAPPLREGTTYVLRAADYRGILMRVVVDARTGAIRDVTRIVPAASGSLGVVLPPYGPPRYYEAPYADGPYGAPVEYEVRPRGLPHPEDGAASQSPVPIAAPAVTRAKAWTRKSSPPLPRPRPPELISAQPPAAAKTRQANGPDGAQPSPPAIPLND
jgi:hypothetical protein